MTCLNPSKLKISFIFTIIIGKCWWQLYNKWVAHNKQVEVKTQKEREGRNDRCKAKTYWQCNSFTRYHQFGKFWNLFCRSSTLWWNLENSQKIFNKNIIICKLFNSLISYRKMSTLTFKYQWNKNITWNVVCDDIES